MGNHRHRTDIVLEVHNGPHLFDSKVHLTLWNSKQGEKKEVRRGDQWGKGETEN
jgi:hypothetical protein